MIVLFPCLYWLKVRMGNTRVLLGHLVYNHLLFLWYFAYVGFRTANPLSLTDIGWFLVHWIATLCFYEIGYAQNDLYAVKQEKNPRLRGAPPQLRKQFSVFVGIRLATALCVLAVSWTYFSKAATASIGAMDLAILAVFMIHNAVKKENRLQTFFLLRFLRYYVFAFIKPASSIIQLELFVFALMYGLVDSLHYLKLDSRVNRSYFLVGNSIALVGFAQMDSMINFFVYPVSLGAFGTLKHALVARAARRSSGMAGHAGLGGRGDI